MRTTAYILVILFVLSCIACEINKGIAVSHDTKEFVFQSNRFHVVGELKIPKIGHKFPVIIMVHGDGPGYRRYYSTLKELFLKVGYATLTWDKPGSGKSTGTFSRKHLQAERADILIDAVEKIKNKPRVDAHRIGVWGISQAGYVIPVALSKTDDITFMILVGVAGENGIEQTAFFVGQQIRCEGYSDKESREADRLVVKVAGAKTYEEYVENGKILLKKYPIVKDLDFMAGILPEDRWEPKDLDGEAYYNPIGIIEQTTIPTLVFFGEKDRNCDPFQGAEAYKNALLKAGNQNFRVELIPNADHTIILCETGCQKERRKRTRSEWSNYASEYLNLMEEWLHHLAESNHEK